MNAQKSCGTREMEVELSEVDQRGKWQRVTWETAGAPGSKLLDVGEGTGQPSVLQRSSKRDSGPRGSRQLELGQLFLLE